MKNTMMTAAAALLVGPEMERPRPEPRPAPEPTHGPKPTKASRRFEKRRRAGKPMWRV